VPSRQLLLDNNNPRFISSKSDELNPDNAIYDQIVTSEKLKNDGGKDIYHINELIDSIIENGWWPIDYIFVRKIDNYYLVLEGNRRVLAVQSILKKENISDELKSQLEKIDVMEIIGTLGDDNFRDQINYLLGVRHHGSLKPWSPFAQAKNIHERYLELLNESEFIWDSSIALTISRTLSIKEKVVENRIRVYRAMQQIGMTPFVKDSEVNGAGMKSRYYSVIEEVLVRMANQVGSYITQNSSTFLLDLESINRMEKLCLFSEKNRQGAPINRPSEWRPFSKILSEKNREKKEKMVTRVVDGHEKPSVVWAERATELQAITWERWFELTHEAIDLPIKVQPTVEGIEVITGLYEILLKLDAVQGNAN